jgi:hypothetical protein
MDKHSWNLYPSGSLNIMEFTHYKISIPFYPHLKSYHLGKQCI